MKNCYFHLWGISKYLNMKTVIVELKNNNALRLLKDLELANIIRLVDEDIGQKKLSEKFRGTLSKQRAEELNEQLKNMRNEWEQRNT